MPTGEGSTVADATLRLTRRSGGITERDVAWQITLDDTAAATIPRGQTVELSIERGYHTLEIRSERHHSPQRSFQAAEGEVVDFSCRAARFWPQWVAALLKPDLWISLKQR